MNKFKEHHNKNSSKAKKNRQGNRIAGSVIGIFTGSLLTKTGVVRYLPFLLFIAFLTLVYIANGYVAEDTVRDLNKVSNELKEMRSEYITTKSDLMYQTKQSQIAVITEQKELGLKESFSPPKKIIVNQSKHSQE